MQMSNSRLVDADVETTWMALNDPDTLKACLPGCEKIERVAEDELLAAMAIRVGPVNAKFNGKIKLSDINPLQSYRLRFEGQGGAAGFAQGEAKVNLTAEEGATRIGYDVKAQVGGKLAQIGSRLIDGAAQKVANDFFAKFCERVGAKPPGPN